MSKNPNVQKLLIIGGPTASGKTKLAIQVAQKFNGEIINADSRQVYKYFDIGTNKEKLQIQESLIPAFFMDDTKIKYWLFDFLDPEEEFSVREYQKLTTNIINNITNRAKLPILVGGTGLYIDAIIKNYKLSTPTDKKLRKKLEKKSVIELQEILKTIGFNLRKLNKSDIKNKVRLIRIIEKLKSSTVNKSTISDSDININRWLNSWFNIPWLNISNQSNRLYNQLNINLNHPKYDYLFLYPEFDREELFKRINNRVLEMFKKGLVKEVKFLIDHGFKNVKPMQGIGYKEVIEYLERKITKQRCIEKIQQSHRNYAKRQITWFEGKGRGYNLTRVTKQNIISVVQNWLAS